MRRLSRFSFLLVVLAFLAASCGTSEDSITQVAGDTEVAVDPVESDTDLELLDTIPGIRLVTANDAASIAAEPPEDLVILDVRTPEEFNAGHVEGAIMLDFYDTDFAAQLAELDPDVPYVLYCNSGNRSGQTTLLMEELGFNDVADVDGGIVAWHEAGLPVVTP